GAAPHRRLPPLRRRATPAGDDRRGHTPPAGRRGRLRAVRPARGVANGAAARPRRGRAADRRDARDRGLARRPRPRRTRSLRGRIPRDARVRAERRMCGRRAAGAHRLPQLRQSRTRRDRLGARTRDRRHRAGGGRARDPGRVRQRLALQRDRRRADPADAGCRLRRARARCRPDPEPVATRRPRVLPARRRRIARAARVAERASLLARDRRLRRGRREVERRAGEPPTAGWARRDRGGRSRSVAGPGRVGDGLTMCGVFGIHAPGRDVARLTYFGLHALQHRGQESAGIAVSEHGRLTALRDLGLVAQVFDEQKLSGLRGEVAIGHTRYSTTGSNAWANAQPLLHHGRARTVALGHNGNLINADELRAAIDGRFASSSDSEVIAALIANDARPLAEAVAATLARLDGAATVVGLAEGKLFGFRDPHGFRPLVLGRLDGDPVLASETCALDLVGAAVDREVRPGELVVVDGDGLRAEQVVPAAERGSLCIFEFFYLARPDTRLAGVEVHGARVRMGERLAAEAPAQADLVLPIPDSGTPAAIGFSRASGIPFSEGLIKNRYV